MYKSNIFHKANISKKLQELHNTPQLSKDDEYVLIKAWKENKDKDSLDKLVFAHLKLVRKIANGYRGYGIPIEDVISEGYLGVMQAVNSFKLEKGFRFSTYLTYCLRSALQKFVLRLSSIVSVTPSNDNKKIFFGGIRKVKKLLDIKDLRETSDEDEKNIADTLNVPISTVKNIIPRYTRSEFSLNRPVGNDNKNIEFQDWIIDDRQKTEKDILIEKDLSKAKKILHKALQTLNKRELEIISQRRLSDDFISFKEIAKKIGISAERVRQIEMNAMKKLKNEISSSIKYKKLMDECLL